MPALGHTHPLGQVVSAHQDIEADRSSGKLLVRV
jgi:hypothetical protein